MCLPVHQVGFHALHEVYIKRLRHRKCTGLRWWAEWLCSVFGEWRAYSQILGTVPALWLQLQTTEEEESDFMEPVLVISPLLKRKMRRKDWWWVHNPLQKRKEHRDFYHLVEELNSRDVWLFWDFHICVNSLWHTGIATWCNLCAMFIWCWLRCRCRHALWRHPYLNEPEQFFSTDAHVQLHVHTDTDACKETRLNKPIHFTGITSAHVASLYKV